MSARIPDLEPINEYESLCYRCGAKEYVYGRQHTEEDCRRNKPVRTKKARAVRSTPTGGPSDAER